METVFHPIYLSTDLFISNPYHLPICLFIYLFIQLSTSQGGGGGYSDVVWTGVRGWSLQTRTPSLRVILAERVPIIRGLVEKGTHY